MTPEQQRIAIAEACGWKTGYRDPEAWHPLPDYLKDLNAMHEAGKILTPKKRIDYWNRLNELVGNPPTDNIYLVWGDVVFATASQRAESFLRTIDKWEEAK
jgi:hypothetical protein